MVKGEIRIIPQCIFEKFSFTTNGFAMTQNDAEIGLFPSLVSLNELSNPLLLNYLCIIVKLF